MFMFLFKLIFIFSFLFMFQSLLDINIFYMFILSSTFIIMFLFFILICVLIFFYVIIIIYDIFLSMFIFFVPLQSTCSYSTFQRFAGSLEELTRSHFFPTFSFLSIYQRLLTYFNLCFKSYLS